MKKFMTVGAALAIGAIGLALPLDAAFARPAGIGARGGARPVFRGGGVRGFSGYRGGGRGIGVGAGIAGLAAGALVGGAIASQGYYGAPYGYGYGGGYGYGYPGDYYAPAYAAPVYSDPGYGDAGPGGDPNYCAATYKSYNPRTGTYLGYDGYQHPCP